MNREIHELINMKARKEELEVELGTSTLDEGHLSHLQRLHIEKDQRRGVDTDVLLEMVNLTIKSDEWIIHNRH